jgi:hypothetical protein
MQSAIASLCKQAVRHRRKMPGGGERKLFLALEVMEEAALGEASGQADVVDGHCRVAFRADHLHGGVQHSRFRLVLRLDFRHFNTNYLV